ncbi:MAG: hypothetical protein KGN16_08610 [Burkholderiales bacterium]|nr:hypothetical protein [Burkholderiales bacterium]
MKPIRIAATTLAACTALALTAARAASSASSEVSDSVSTSVGSLSNSITGSSNASSPGDRKFAAGAYRIVAIGAEGGADDHPGMVALQLQALAEPGAAGGLTLHLPRATVEQTRLAAGGLVDVRLRPYGVEFAQGARREPFFLVLHDDWYRELQTRAVAI